MTGLRLRRQSELPTEYGERAYRSASALPIIPIGEDGLTVEYAVSSPAFVAPEADVPLDEVRYHLRQQHCRGWVRYEGEAVGGVDLYRFIVPTFMTNEEFIDVMDSDSSETHRLSCALADELESVSEDAGDYGDIVELRRIWLSPIPSVAGKSKEIVNGLIGAFCPDFSLIALKAYPLEYEGNLPDDSPLVPAFKRRQAALMRHYARELGVAPMSGRYGREGWMFRFHESLRDRG